jgi:hypothetical protein
VPCIAELKSSTSTLQLPFHLLDTPPEMRHQAELGLRRLLLTVSTFVFLAALVAIYALRFLPEDPLHLRKSLSVYLVFFLIVSLIGLSGAVKVSLIQEPKPNLRLARRLIDILSEMPPSSLSSPHTSSSMPFSFSFLASFSYASASHCQLSYAATPNIQKTTLPTSVRPHQHSGLLQAAGKTPLESSHRRHGVKVVVECGCGDSKLCL